MIEMAQGVQSKSHARLKKLEERFADDGSFLSKANQNKEGLTLGLFALLTEMCTLEDEREKLQESLDKKDLQGAQLPSPIYVADYPIYPKKAISLAVGILERAYS